MRNNDQSQTTKVRVTTALKVTLATAALAIPLAIFAADNDAANAQGDMQAPSAMQDHSMVMTQAATETQNDLQAGMDRLFVVKAAMGNAGEVETGQLALRNSSNEQVRNLAAMLVRQHGMANNALMGLARNKDFAFTTDPGPTNKAVARQLSGSKGDKFDRMFIATQVEAHENTITLLQQEIAMGMDADVKAYASRNLPAILNHTAIIYALARQLDAPGVELRPQALTDNASPNTIGEQGAPALSPSDRREIERSNGKD